MIRSIALHARVFSIALACLFAWGSVADAGNAGPACTRVAVSNVGNLLNASGNSWTYRLGPDVDLGLGGPALDTILIEFYGLANGTFALGTGANANYATCEQCVRLVQDVDGATPINFFADSGNLVTNQDQGDPTMFIGLQDVRLVEVTIDPDDFTSTPVPGGACLLLDQELVFGDGFEPATG